jgi:hypothetical protein
MATSWAAPGTRLPATSARRPSAPRLRYAAAIMARLDAAHDGFSHQSLVYPGTGHAVAPPSRMGRRS